MSYPTMGWWVSGGGMVGMLDEIGLLRYIANE